MKYSTCVERGTNEKTYLNICQSNLTCWRFGKIFNVYALRSASYLLRITQPNTQNCQRDNKNLGRGFTAQQLFYVFLKPLTRFGKVDSSLNWKAYYYSILPTPEILCNRPVFHRQLQISSFWLLPYEIWCSTGKCVGTYALPDICCRHSSNRQHHDRHLSRWHGHPVYS